MREINDHKTNTVNDNLQIQVLDEPGDGGASHKYVINLLCDPGLSYGITAEQWTTRINFQNGPIKEAGVNGVTQEALIAICIDRLRSFQAGQYSCRENAVALTHLETALMWLQKRTLDRVRRGVEGTHQK